MVEQAAHFPEARIRRILEDDCFPHIGRGLIAIDGTAWWKQDIKTKEVVAFANVSDSGTIWNVCTACKYRRQGHAEDLLRALLASPRTRGRMLTLYVLKTAPGPLQLYLKLGFRIVGNGTDSGSWKMVLNNNSE